MLYPKIEKAIREQDAARIAQLAEMIADVLRSGRRTSNMLMAGYLKELVDAMPPHDGQRIACWRFLAAGVGVKDFDRALEKVLKNPGAAIYPPQKPNEIYPPEPRAPEDITGFLKTMWNMAGSMLCEAVESAVVVPDNKKRLLKSRAPKFPNAMANAIYRRIGARLVNREDYNLSLAYGSDDTILAVRNQHWPREAEVLAILRAAAG